MGNYEHLVNFRTPFAKKYGVRNPEKDKSDLFSVAGKSGYTPTQPRGLRPTSTLTDKRDLEIENGQKKFLYGFTARELVELGSYPDPTATLATLNNAIHPIYHRIHWETVENVVQSKRFFPIDAQGSCYSLGNGSLGYWLASNDVVWQLLLPILRIASRVLDDTITIPLLDTFLCGTYSALLESQDPRPLDEKVEDGPLYVVRSRHPSNYADAAMLQKKRDAITLLESKIRLKIGSAHFQHDNMEPESDFTGGCTMGEGNAYYPPTSVDVLLAYELLQPLLRNDLSPSERLLEQFLCGITLAHETMHAIHTAMGHSNHNEPWYNYTEPFFDDHIFSELGFALEQELLLGTVLMFPDSNHGEPHLGSMAGSHPSRHFNVYGSQVVKYGDAGLPAETTLQPIPSKFYYNLQSDEFWDFAVRKWGVDMLRPQSGPHAHIDSKVRASVRTIQRAALNWETDLHADFYGKDPHQFLLGKTPQEISAWSMALARDKQRRNAQRRVAFRTERVTVGIRFHRWLDNHNFSVSADGEQDGYLEFAIKGIEEECHVQAEEICTFMVMPPTQYPHEPYDSQWLQYLQRINRELRMIYYDIERASNRTSGERQARCVPYLQNILGSLLSSFHILQQDRASMMNIPHSTDWKVIMNHVAQNLALNSEQVKATAWDAENYNPRAEDDFISRILEEGRQALRTSNAVACKELGLEIFRNFAWDHFMRAVGTILLSRDGVSEHRDLWKQMTMLVEESLNDSETPEEEMRQFWAGWLIDEKAKEASGHGANLGPSTTTTLAGCAKRGRNPSLDIVFAQEEMARMNSARKL